MFYISKRIATLGKGFRTECWMFLTSSGGLPLSRMWRRQELKLAASGWTYLAAGPVLWEWNMNLLGEKKRPHVEHLMHLALEELYREGRKAPRQPQAQSWWTAKAKSSGRRGGELSPRKDLQRRSASRLVIIPAVIQSLGCLIRFRGHESFMQSISDIIIRTYVLPHLLEDTGMAPALRSISSCTGVHWTQVMPKATRLLWISL